VREAKLVVKTVGPDRVLVGDPAAFTLTVTNPGDGPAEHVRIMADLSAGLDHPRGSKVDFGLGNLGPGESRSVQVVCLTKTGGQHDGATRTVSWFLGEVGPGQTREVNVEVVCVTTGEFSHKVAAQASRGLKVEGETQTRVEGLSALQLDVTDLEDPVELNGDA